MLQKFFTFLLFASLQAMVATPAELLVGWCRDE